MEENRSEISYWFNDEEVLNVPTSKVPEIGELFYMNTRMDPEWHDAHFKNRKLFREGVRGEFIVKDVKRFYKAYDYKGEMKLPGSSDTSGETTYVLPMQRVVETFEVQIVPTDDVRYIKDYIRDCMEGKDQEEALQLIDKLVDFLDIAEQKDIDDIKDALEKRLKQLEEIQNGNKGS